MNKVSTIDRFAPSLSLQEPSNIFFLKGNDLRILNPSQQIEIAKIVSTNILQTSSYVYNSYEAKRKYQSWVNTFPWIQPYFAFKSNPSQCFIQDLIKEGSSFDCASKSEIEFLLKLGVDPQKIVYSNSIKDEIELEWAENNNVQLTTADTLDELRKIKKKAPRMKILWRIAIEEDKNDNLVSTFSGKFGDDIDTEEKIAKRMKEIQQMGIKLSGIHFHCGSGDHGSNVFEKAILNARLCIQIGRHYGHEMKVLDIGGGFPSGQISQKTIKALKITENDPLDYRVIAEPGRYFSANSFYVLTKVIGTRIKNNKKCYHLNDSLYHAFNCVLRYNVSLEGKDQFYSKVDLSQFERREIPEKETSTLFGMTCDGMDIIARNAYVPVEMKEGDWLCISGMGAYTYGPRSEFNGMKSIEKVIPWSAKIDQNSLHTLHAGTP